MVVIRWVLGRLILLFDWLFQPKGIKRDPEMQAKIDLDAQSLSLYQYKACPFCVKVRRSMKRQSLNIETRDAKGSNEHAKELTELGGRLKVPCLRIQKEGEDTWLYESNEIIRYLETHYAA